MEKLTAYLKICTIRQDGSRDSFLTQSVEVKREPMRHHLQGLQFTASGYGSRIPTEYMVKYHGKWRRVYCIVYSNSGTLFIGKKYDGSLIVDIGE